MSTVENNLVKRKSRRIVIHDLRYFLIASISESWLRKSEQGDKWSFCLTAVKINPRIRRDDEQTSTPDAHTGI